MARSGLNKVAKRAMFGDTHFYQCSAIKPIRTAKGCSTALERVPPRRSSSNAAHDRLRFKALSFGSDKKSTFGRFAQVVFPYFPQRSELFWFEKGAPVERPE
ncbi:hypothetical protein COLO4_33201 [Corchorus olitorius]|uniref:Uncharacterized protein n=1 Tax=Corchorus olitorius TaxID=93759 RepID=A0A1R3GVI7_9ROSI|nr:hypothetical protein COLO4_33201 [Corchorus olitorius]